MSNVKRLSQKSPVLQLSSIESFPQVVEKYR